MLDFGFSEVVVTSLIALVVLGPKRLPTVVRQVGSWMGRARVMARQLSEQLDREINAEELLKTRPPAATAPAASIPPPLPPDITHAPDSAATPATPASPASPAAAIDPYPAAATTPAAMHPVPASATTPAAMHPVPPAAPTAEPASSIKPSHE